MGMESPLIETDKKTELTTEVSKLKLLRILAYISTKITT